MSPGPDDPRARGQATVEVALALPVVVLALLLVIQVALIARAQVLVTHAAREGARAAAVDGPSAAGPAARATPGLRAGRVHVATSGGSEAGDAVRVTVRYRAPTDLPIVGALLGDPELSAVVVMRRDESADP